VDGVAADAELLVDLGGGALGSVVAWAWSQGNSAIRARQAASAWTPKAIK